MMIRCPNCDAECETEVELAPGQHVLCPFCETKFCYTPQETTVENAQGEMPQMTENRTEGSTIKIMCPYCGAGYEVDSGYEGEIATCGSCSKKFVVQVAHEKQTGSQQTNKASAPHKKVMRKFVLSNDGGSPMTKRAHIGVTQEGRKHNARGCLPAALFFLSWFFVAISHNWASVAVSVACAFTAIMMCVYNKLYTQMNGQTTVGDVFKRLGIGGSSIFLIAFTLGCTFLMHSCDRQAKEEELESQRNARIVRERKEEEMRNTNLYSITCPVCNFKGPIFIKKGTNLADVRKRCPGCGYFMDYRHLLPAGY